MDRKIKVMVVDDSALMRKIISDMINSQRDMEVVDIAKNGEELLKKMEVNTPDVITLDVEMPIMSGITTLKYLKRIKSKVKIIMLSSLTKDGAEITMECLENGAIDFICKPSGNISLNIAEVKEDLINKIRHASRISPFRKVVLLKKDEDPKDSIKKTFLSKKTKEEKKHNSKIKAVVIGASTGGPKALSNVIPALPKDLGVPVFVVQHMPIGFTRAFAERLNRTSNLKVVEAENNMIVEKNTVYIAKAGYHMEISNKTIKLMGTPTVWGVRPAVDRLFLTASKCYGSSLLSVVLTGMGKDGAKGTIEVKNNGGHTMTEDVSTCVIYGMPKAAFETNMVDEVLPLHHISSKIVKLVRGVE